MSLQTVLIIAISPSNTYKGQPFIRVKYRAAVDGAAEKWASCFRNRIFGEIALAHARKEPVSLDIVLADKVDHEGNRYLNILDVEDKRQVDIFKPGEGAMAEAFARAQADRVTT